MFSVFLCWFEVLTSHKSLRFKNCRVNLSLAKLHLLETLNLFKSVAAAAKSQRTFWGTQLEIEFQAALKHLFHKRMSLVRLQDSQSYLELWPVHCGLPTGCFFFFKSTFMTGPFSLCVTRPVWGLMGFTCTVMSPLCEELALGRVVMDCRFAAFETSAWDVPFEGLALWVCIWAPFHHSASLPSTSWMEPTALWGILRKQNLEQKA